MLDIGIIIPQLSLYGGAQRLAIECIARWQHKHQLTLYSCSFDKRILCEHGVDVESSSLVQLSRAHPGPHMLVQQAVLEPKIWEQEIGRHQVYLAHQWPTHLIDKHPLVWYAHEPLRLLHDVRFNQSVDGTIKAVSKILSSGVEGINLRSLDVWRHASLEVVSQFDQLGRPDRIVANSRYTAGYLASVYSREVKDVVYPGVNVGDFLYMPPVEDIFLAVGNLGAHKRTRVILEALQQVEGVDLYVAGSGSYQPQLERMAAQLGLSERVFFLNGLKNSEVQVLFARCLGVLFTPVKEPFGIVALEAMAAGKPLIAVNEGGYTEVVDESCAFLVPPQPGAIADKIQYLKENKTVAKKMGLAGQAKVQEFSWDRTASELLAILEDTHRTWTGCWSTRLAFPQTDLSWERGGRPEGGPKLRAPGRSSLFGVIYECGYRDGLGATGWNHEPTHGVTDKPALGYYASSHGTIIEDHLRSLDAAGIDFVVLNLHLPAAGVDAYELVAMENILGVAQKMNARQRFAIQVCWEGGSIQDSARVPELIRSAFALQPNYLHLKDRPVLFVSRAQDLGRNKIWSRWLHEHTQDFLRITSQPIRKTDEKPWQTPFEPHAGWALSGPLEPADVVAQAELWGRTQRECQLHGPAVRILTLSPGYDDTHLPASSRAGKVIDRRNGRTFQQMIDQALALELPPDLVLVASFNDYHRNTHVEASRNNGSVYLEMTRQFIEKARAAWHQPVARPLPRQVRMAI